MKNSSPPSNRSLGSDYALFVDFYLVPKCPPGAKPCRVPPTDKRCSMFCHPPPGSLLRAKMQFNNKTPSCRVCYGCVINPFKEQSLSFLELSLQV